MNLKQCLECNTPDVVFENFGDEIILLQLQSGSYYTLNPTGMFYWECVSQGVPPADAAERLRADYPESSVAADLEALLGQFLAENLLRPSATSRALGEITVATALPPQYLRPEMTRYTDLTEMLLLDPVHDVGEAGWPEPAPARQEQGPN